MPGGVVTGLVESPILAAFRPTDLAQKQISRLWSKCVSMAWQAQGRVHVCHHGMEGRGARGRLQSFTASSAAVKTLKPFLL